MKRVAIHQSQYLPWPPYFRKMAAADVFIVMDSVQYQKNGVQNRNKIRNKDSEFWLTIPVTGQLSDTIAEKKLADARWPQKHWKSIQGAYARAPFWREFAPALEALYAAPYATLAGVNEAFLALLAEASGVATPRVNLSDLPAEGSASALVLSACRAVGADVYVSGVGAKAYLDEEAFRAAGVRIEYLAAEAPVYRQFHDDRFFPGLSMLDMLLNVGREGCSAYAHSQGISHA